jgi:hypothetical protein
MNKENKAIQKTVRSKIRKEKAIKRLLKKIEDRESSLLDCPFDVDMNGEYGTCDCNGVNKESCTMET